MTLPPFPEMGEEARSENTSLLGSHHTFSPVRSDRPPRHPSGPHHRGSGPALPPLHEGYWEWFLFSICSISVLCCLAGKNEDHTISLTLTGETTCDPGYANNDSFNQLLADSKA